MTLFNTLGDILRPVNSNPYLDLVKDYKDNQSKKARLTKLLTKNEELLFDAETFLANGAVLYKGKDIHKFISSLVYDISLIKKAYEKFNSI